MASMHGSGGSRRLRSPLPDQYFFKTMAHCIAIIPKTYRAISILSFPQFGLR